IHDVRNILHEQRQWFCALHIVKVTQIKVGARVYLESRWVFGDLTQFSTSHARIGLTGWSAHNDVKRLVGRSQPQLVAEILRLDSCDVTGLRVLSVARMKIQRMRLRSKLIKLNGRINAETGVLKSQ